MGVRRAGILIAALACVGLLSGCGSSGQLGSFGSQAPTSDTSATSGDGAAAPSGTDATNSITFPGDKRSDEPTGLLGNDPNDDLNLGKKQFRAANFGLAEKYFRRAVELHPRDAEAWVGLAACYDRLRRFDLADRAYAQAKLILGNSPEVLNNQGYSYMLRGDYNRARKTLLEAQARDPSNPYIRNNLELLEKAYRRGKAVQ